MNVRRHTRLRLVLGAFLAVACLCGLVPGAAAASLATGTFQVGSVGETVSIPIVLDSASGGISGYRITVSLSNPSVATITGVTFPDWASLKSSTAVPSRQVVLQGIDLSQQVPVGGAGVLIATLTVKGTATGSTGIVVTPDAGMGVQDRGGNLYPIAASTGTLTVGSPSGGGSPTVPTVVVPPTAATPVVPPVGPPVVPPTVVTPVVPTGGVQPPVNPTPVPTGAIPTFVPPSDGSTPIPTSNPVIVYPVEPVTTPGEVFPVSPGNPAVIVTPTAIVPGGQPTFAPGKRYAIGNPGSYIGTRFSVGGAPTGTGSRAVTTLEPTLKPGSRAYGLKPPAGRFIRWYPEARWKAGIK